MPPQRSRESRLPVPHSHGCMIPGDRPTVPSKLQQLQAEYQARLARDKERRLQVMFERQQEQQVCLLRTRAISLEALRFERPMRLVKYVCHEIYAFWGFTGENVQQDYAEQQCGEREEQWAAQHVNGHRRRRQGFLQTAPPEK